MQRCWRRLKICMCQPRAFSRLDDKTYDQLTTRFTTGEIKCAAAVSIQEVGAAAVFLIERTLTRIPQHDIMVMEPIDIKEG